MRIRLCCFCIYSIGILHCIQRLCAIAERTELPETQLRSALDEYMRHLLCEKEGFSLARKRKVLQKIPAYLRPVKGGEPHQR